ncbi:hypothetical protein BDR04DRAFT_1112730 [Suillus decipiens]|nr:hypothetical protein BDR04DRAFT_1112730 [Suillus decipiens]
MPINLNIILTTDTTSAQPVDLPSEGNTDHVNLVDNFDRMKLFSPEDSSDPFVCSLLQVQLPHLVHFKLVQDNQINLDNSISEGSSVSIYSPQNYDYLALELGFFIFNDFCGTTRCLCTPIKEEDEEEELSSMESQGGLLLSCDISASSVPSAQAGHFPSHIPLSPSTPFIRHLSTLIQEGEEEEAVKESEDGPQWQGINADEECGHICMRHLICKASGKAVKQTRG